MRLLLSALIALTLLSFTGCTSERDEETLAEWQARFFEGEDHPQLARLPYEIQIPEARPGDRRAAALRTHIERLMRQNPVVVGEDEGDGAVLFGRITNVSAIGNEIFVSDASNNRVIVLDPAGRLVDVIGQPGEGPGEFRQVHDVFGQDGGILILDANRRFSLWERTPKGFTLEDHRNYQMVTRSACRLGDEFVVHAPVPQRGVIHIYDSSGEHVRSFGHLYRSDNLAVTDALSSSFVACVDEPETIVLAFRAFATLAAFTRVGELLWTAPVLGVPPSGSREAGGGVRFHDARAPRGISAFKYHPGYGLILTVFDAGEREGDFSSYSTYLVDEATGAMTYITTLPGVPNVISDSFVVLSSYRPAPVISVYGR
jgi:hypothetical protein